MRSSTAWLLVALLITSVLVIEVRHRSRVMFADLQALQAQRDALNTEWGRLLLEEGAWSQHRRIEDIARSRLNMSMPAPDRVVVLGRRRDENP